MAPFGVVNWHIGRCGSSVLGSLLAQHSAVAYSNEIFSPYMPRRRRERPLPELEEVVREARYQLRHRFHLFEVKHLHAQNLGLYPSRSREEWLNQLIALGYERHLLMRRRNGLRRMLSHIRAAGTGVYVASDGDASPTDAVTIPLDFIVHGFQSRSLLEWLEEYERGHQQMVAALDHVGLPWLELSYEDHIETSPMLAYAEVCRYLEIDPETPELRLRKINRGRLSDLISNFDAVQAALAPTRFAWMLED